MNDSNQTPTQLPSFKTDQEAFWAGEFGDEYRTRNNDDWLLRSNIAMFTRILSRTRKVETVIEFGANIGLNLSAINAINPRIQLSAVEINSGACDEISARLPAVSVHNTSILDFSPETKSDLVLIKGVLIHINPEYLSEVYDKLAGTTHRYVVIAEYFNTTPVAESYRGHTERLFKRDFAGDFLARHPDFSVVDYAFVWRHDPVFPQGDVTWFLLERRQ